MSFVEAIRALNRLKQRRVIRDYVVFGAVAATAYMEPMLTQDLDIIVLVDSGEEYMETFRRVGESADGLDGMHHILGGRPVQMFPSTLKPIYLDTIAHSKSSRIGNIRVKLASPAHLVILALEAFRLKDKLRIEELLKTSSVVREAVYDLLEEFDDDEQTLRSRFQTII
jgi:hypothetical protein